MIKIINIFAACGLILVLILSLFFLDIFGAMLNPKNNRSSTSFVPWENVRLDLYQFNDFAHNAPKHTQIIFVITSEKGVLREDYTAIYNTEYRTTNNDKEIIIDLIKLQEGGYPPLSHWPNGEYPMEPGIQIDISKISDNPITIIINKEGSSEQGKYIVSLNDGNIVINEVIKAPFINSASLTNLKLADTRLVRIKCNNNYKDDKIIGDFIFGQYKWDQWAPPNTNKVKNVNMPGMGEVGKPYLYIFGVSDLSIKDIYNNIIEKYPQYEKELEVSEFYVNGVWNSYP